MSKHKQRMRHVIAHDASPYFASTLENSRFSTKAQYVNGVHLIPLARNPRPWSDAPRTIQRMFPLRTEKKLPQTPACGNLPAPSMEKSSSLFCNHCASKCLSTHPAHHRINTTLGAKSDSTTARGRDISPIRPSSFKVRQRKIRRPSRIVWRTAH